MRRRTGALAFTVAVVLAGTLAYSCGSQASSPSRSATAGLPIYPHATAVGATSDKLAIYRSTDSYREVADWYGSHLPKGTQAARNDDRSQATFAIFSPSETKTVHVEISDGTVRVTMSDVKTGPAPPTGR